MRSIHVVMLALALTLPLPIQAQSDATASPDSTAPLPKKKGLFGKMKGLAKNKVVNQVAKVALCSAVPGGQVIAGALEAKEAKNAAGGATAALAGGNGACMPGMNGLAQGGAASGVAGAVAGAGMSAALVKQGQSSPPESGDGGMSAEQMKELEAQYRRMGVSPTQIKAMKEQMRALPQSGGGTSAEPLASSESAPAGYAAADVGAGATAMTREKRRLVLRQLPWMPGSEGVVEGAGPVFGLAMRDLAAAMLTSPSRYRIEVRVEEQGSKSANRLLARKRADAVIAALGAEGIPAERLTAADGGGDKDPRTVASEGK